jgi:hypothetical protein
LSVYWIVHRKFSKSDWTSDLQGNPSYIYSNIGHLVFLDISEFGLLSFLQRKLLHLKKYPLFDYNDLNKNKYLLIKKKKELKNILNTMNSSDIVVFQDYVPGLSCINLVLKYFNRYKINTLLLYYWKIPFSQAILQTKKKRIKTFLSMKLLEQLYYMIFVLTKIFAKAQMFTFVMCSGYNQSIEIKKTINFKDIIPMHSISYDQYIENSNKKHCNCFTYDYLVFIDQALTIHPDILFEKKEDSHKYQKELEIFFSYIESKTNLPIIIAAHPRCQYSANFWGNRKVRINETEELINNAKGVIGHFSTILCYAFLNNKQLYFINSCSDYFIWKEHVNGAFNFFGGTLYMMDQYSNILITEKEKSFIDLYSYFTLCPEDKRTNKELLFNFLKNIS